GGTASPSTASCLTPPAPPPVLSAVIRISRSCATPLTSPSWRSCKASCSTACGLCLNPAVSCCTPPVPSCLKKIPRWSKHSSIDSQPLPVIYWTSLGALHSPAAVNCCPG